MAQNVLFLLCLITIFDLAKFEQTGYYWRDYTGVVPEDAFPAGKDINGNNVYIGQVYFHGYGLYPVSIFPDKNEIEFHAYGVRKTDSSSVIKILCSDHEDNFKWIKTSSKTIRKDTSDKNLVLGGYYTKVGVWNSYIGRVQYYGSTLIGNINDIVRSNALFYSVYKKKELLHIEDYEVLVYETPILHQ